MVNKDLNVIKEHWENKDTVSLRDTNLQLVERKTIIGFLEQTNKKTLKDIGCGDGSDTIHFAKYVDNVFAYDYSSAMLEKASKNLDGIKNVSLSQLDMLKDDITTKTDVAITKRMLINLGNFGNQKNAILKIHDSLEDNGYFIMLETSTDGLKNLNELRETFNLDTIPEPFHNTLFELDRLKEFLEEYFIIEEIKYFSTYFFLTRIYNMKLENNEDFKYDTLAKDFAINCTDLFADKIIGPQFCMLLKKKS